MSETNKNQQKPLKANKTKQEPTEMPETSKNQQKPTKPLGTSRNQEKTTQTRKKQ